MATFYAWSPIRHGVDEKTNRPKEVALGEQVTREKLGVSKADWDDLVEARVVRTSKYPAPDDYEGSALDYLREQRIKALETNEDEILASEMEAVAEVQ